MDSKTLAFHIAIEKYLNDPIYRRFERFVSFSVVMLQVISVWGWFCSGQSISSLECFLTLVMAYVVTDFVNGLVHMFMDNNTHYTSFVGPYIAAFHLHHAKYFYQVRPFLKVYFDESGTKFWLLFYLVCLVVIQRYVPLSSCLHVGLIALGIFSSVAELSHYYCHQATENDRIVLWLQRYHVLLSKSRHRAHHGADNMQYAFLNGVTDPLINFIARRCCKGYKNGADQHTQAYLSTLKSSKIIQN